MILDVVDGFQKLDGRVAIERVTAVTHLVQSLEVRRQLDALLH